MPKKHLTHMIGKYGDFKNLDHSENGIFRAKKNEIEKNIPKKLPRMLFEASQALR